LLSEADLAQIRASRQAFDEAERPFALMILLMACGRKP
jgi:hypothetical protein